MDRRWIVALALAVAACGGGGGDGDGGNEPAAGDEPYDDQATYSQLGSASLANPVEGASKVQREITLGGQRIAYTARAGHLVARTPSAGAAQASFFYVAYTRDGAAPATRPVTFFYNGGPGSASVWLHLGSFGPKRLDANLPSTSTARPFRFVDNAESLLDVTDLVFVDAVGAGLSQAVAPKRNSAFWGVDADAEAFRDFVRRYVEVYAREASPKFLFGESYGTTRTAVLAPLLEAAGVKLAGLVLLSSVLDYNSNCGVMEPVTVTCAGYLPTYGETGAWHGLAADSSVSALRRYSADTYEPASEAWLGARTPPSTDLTAELESLTGLDSSWWRRDVNVTPGVFQVNLVPDRLIGRYDARVVVDKGDALAREGDPSSTVLTSSFTETIADLLREELLYTHRGSYTMFAADALRQWNFSHDGQALPDAVTDLGAALALNPALRVMSVNGVHDLATPFHQTERDLARLGTLPGLTVRNYSGGHMMYLDDKARVKLKADLVTFYGEALR